MKRIHKDGKIYYSYNDSIPQSVFGSDVHSGMTRVMDGVTGYSYEGPGWEVFMSVYPEGRADVSKWTETPKGKTFESLRLAER